MSAEQKTEHQYGEAFKLMLYQGTSGRVVDIWNSRNGVTPFMVDIDGEEYSHIAFKFDRSAPNHTLRPGDYFFRGMTEDEATRYAAKIVDMRDAEVEAAAKLTDRERQEEIETFAREIWRNGESPMIDRAPFVTITDPDGYRAGLRAAAEKIKHAPSVQLAVLLLKELSERE